VQLLQHGKPGIAKTFRQEASHQIASAKRGFCRCLSGDLKKKKKTDFYQGKRFSLGKLKPKKSICGFACLDKRKQFHSRTTETNSLFSPGENSPAPKNIEEENLQLLFGLLPKGDNGLLLHSERKTPPQTKENKKKKKKKKTPPTTKNHK